MSFAPFAAAVAASPSARLAEGSGAGPGVIGFLVTFGLALATWMLMRSMAKRIRRLRYAALAEENISGADVVGAPTAAAPASPGTQERVAGTPSAPGEPGA